MNNNLFVNKWPKLIEEWHPTKNNDLNPEKFTYGSHVKVWWMCKNKTIFDKNQ